MGSFGPPIFGSPSESPRFWTSPCPVPCSPLNTQPSSYLLRWPGGVGGPGLGGLRPHARGASGAWGRQAVAVGGLDVQPPRSNWKGWAMQLRAVDRRRGAVIPIVFATAGDPVGTGIVASLSRPGGNITGLSGQASDTTGKRIELLREIVPGLRRLQGSPGPCSGAVRHSRSAPFHKPGSYKYLRTRREITDDVHCTGAGRSGRSDVLWT